METFEEFFKKETSEIIEEGFLDVPRKLLGMKTSVAELPDKAPYGFWVDKSGNYMETPPEGHFDQAQQILTKANKFLAKNGRNPIEVIDEDDYYETLFREGWMRVVLPTAYYYEGDMFYEMGKGEHANYPTNSQTKFLKFVRDLYGRREIRAE